MTCQQLPGEIWEIICSHLNITDIFNLRLANKSINYRVQYQRVWKNIVRTKWYEYADSDRNEFLAINNYYESFKKKNRNEAHIRKILDSCSERNATIEEVISNGWQIVSNEKWAIYSLLNIIKDLEARPLENVLKIYLSKRFIKSLRSKEGVALIRDSFKRSQTQSSFVHAPEEWLFQLSYFDLAFDELLPIREKVINDVVSLYKQRKTKSGELSPKDRILFIVAQLRIIWKQQKDMGVNSTSILGIYHGQIMGTQYDQMLEYAIIHKIGVLLGVSCAVTHGGLILYPGDKTIFPHIIFVGNSFNMTVHEINELQFSQQRHALYWLTTPISYAKVLGSAIDSVDVTEKRSSFASFAEIDLSYLASFCKLISQQYSLSTGQSMEWEIEEWNDCFIEQLKGWQVFDYCWIRKDLPSEFAKRSLQNFGSASDFTESFSKSLMAEFLDDSPVEFLNKEVVSVNLSVGQILCSARFALPQVFLGAIENLGSVYVGTPNGVFLSKLEGLLLYDWKNNQSKVEKYSSQKVGILIQEFDYKNNRFILSSIWESIWERFKKRIGDRLNV